MTISYVEPVITYVSSGNGAYPFTFKILAESDIEVWYTSASTGARIQLVRGSDFSVTIGNPGGTVTILGNAPAGGQILIQRRVPIDQPTDWVNNGPFDMDLLEADLDRIIMIVQQLGWDVSSGQAAINWRGTWATLAEYTIRDLVKTSNGNYYFCIVSHTAGTFATDLAAGKWVLVLDFAAVQTQATNAAASAADALASKNTAIARAAAAELSEIAAAASEVAAAQSASNAAQSAANILDWPVSNGLATDIAALLSVQRKNLLINGGFDVWQRGTSYFGSPGYCADRWYFNIVSGTGGYILRNSFTRGQTTVPGGPLYYVNFKVDRTSGVSLAQRIPNFVQFMGKKLTCTFWAKLSTGMVNAYLDVQLNANYGTGGTPSPSTAPIATGTTGSFVPTTTWTKYTSTFNVPVVAPTWGTDVGSDYLELQFTLANDTGTDGLVNIANVQLEFGDTATDFEYRHPAEELMLCQRYYEVGTATIPWTANQLTATIARSQAIPYKVTKRVTPTLSIGALTVDGHDGTPGTFNSMYTTADEFCAHWNWSGGTPGRAFSAQFSWSADAEL